MIRVVAVEVGGLSTGGVVVDELAVDAGSSACENVG